MKFEFKGVEYYIDGFLATALDSLVHNIKKDWDVVVLITGDRTVRTGKSVLGMTVGAYLGAALKKLELNENAYTINDIYFNSSVMVEEAINKPKYSVNHYDEARESLAAIKTQKKIQQDIIDFFNECGQLNQFFVLVLPDFFTLKEDIAVARSEFLLNVYRTEEKKMVDLYKDGVKRPVVEFKRGRFEFFNREKKGKLYDKARMTKRKSYDLVKADFIGRFTNQYALDKEKYLELKRDSLKRFKETHKKEDVKLLTKTRYFLEIASFLTHKQLEEMSLKLDRSRSYLEIALAKAKAEAEPFLKAEKDKKALEIGEIG